MTPTSEFTISESSEVLHCEIYMDNLEKKWGMILQSFHYKVRVEGSGRQLLSHLPLTNPRGQHIFSNKDQVIRLLGFVSHAASAATAHLCWGRKQAAADKSKQVGMAVFQ